MTKYSKNQKPSQQTQDEAMAVAKGTQRPGQSKEQTRLIAQGVQKGIEQYKKQQKSRARELDKMLKEASRKKGSGDNSDNLAEVEIHYKQHWLPWVLLVISWLAIAALVFGLV